MVILDMKKLFLINLLIFSVNVYAQSFLCEVVNEQTVDHLLWSGSDYEVKMATLEINDREIILYEKIKGDPESKIADKINKIVFSSKEKINLDKSTEITRTEEKTGTYIFSYMRDVKEDTLLINSTFVAPFISDVKLYKCLENK